MKLRILHLLLIISSLFGYLEWGSDQHTFLLTAEMEILTSLFSDPLSVLHPFTLIPLLGQILLLINIFLKQPKKFLSYLGIGSISILFLLMLFIGLMEFNLKILGSTLPFLIISGTIIVLDWKQRRSELISVFHPESRIYFTWFVKVVYQ